MKRFISLFLTLAMLLLLASCAILNPPSDAEVPAGTAEKMQPEAPTETEAQIQTEEPEPDTVETEPEKPEADRTGEEVYLAHSELTPVNYDSPALLPRTEDAGQSYIDNITFLCDSPFYWLKLYELLSDGFATTQIWTGPEGTMTLAYLRWYEILDPIDNVLRTIPEAVAAHKPPMILITVGINGVALLDEEGFKEEYIHLIDEIKNASPDTVIVLQSILPISPMYANWGMITNASITAANSWILEVAEICGLHYLDTFSVLVGDDGNIRPDLVRADGLHANEEGLKLALEYIRTHAYTPAVDSEN